MTINQEQQPPVTTEITYQEHRTEIDFAQNPKTFDLSNINNRPQHQVPSSNDKDGKTREQMTGSFNQKPCNLFENFNKTNALDNKDETKNRFWPKSRDNEISPKDISNFDRFNKNADIYTQSKKENEKLENEIREEIKENNGSTQQNYQRSGSKVTFPGNDNTESEDGNDINYCLQNLKLPQHEDGNHNKPGQFPVPLSKNVNNPPSRRRKEMITDFADYASNDPSEELSYSLKKIRISGNLHAHI